jgi:transposase-like protein
MSESLFIDSKPKLYSLKSCFEKERRMDYEIKNVEIEEEFKVCPSCGYKDGFHSMFKREGGVTKWLFICPSCHEIFDIGFTV